MPPPLLTWAAGQAVRCCTPDAPLLDDPSATPHGAACPRDHRQHCANTPPPAPCARGGDTETCVHLKGQGMYRLWHCVQHACPPTMHSLPPCACLYTMPSFVPAPPSHPSPLFRCPKWAYLYVQPRVAIPVSLDVGYGGARLARQCVPTIVLPTVPPCVLPGGPGLPPPRSWNAQELPEAPLTRQPDGDCSGCLPATEAPGPGDGSRGCGAIASIQAWRCVRCPHLQGPQGQGG